MPTELWNKEFPITSVTREDLVVAGITRAQARSITDAQMTAIARKMGDYYVDFGDYWNHVRDALAYVLQYDSNSHEIA